ncbi:MAG: hypothetical protein ACK4JE_05485 [Endomicrobiia bacterium]
MVTHKDYKVIMDRFFKKVILVQLLCLGLSCSIVAGSTVDLSNQLGISVGYPYFSLKYGISKNFTGEIRYAFAEGINVCSVRGYYNFYFGEKILGFSGADLGYISFDTEGIKGNGYLFMGFIGGEYFISKSFSIGIDFGPAFISVGAKEFGKDFSVDGIEWVFNLGINYYFSLSHNRPKQSH